VGIPAGRARETIRHHEASCRPVQIQSAPGRPYPGRPHSRDYLSPRGEQLSHSRISYTVFNLELDCKHLTQACSSSSRRCPPGSSLLPPDASPLTFEFAPSKHHPRSPFSQVSSPPAHRLESQGYPGAPNQSTEQFLNFKCKCCRCEFASIRAYDTHRRHRSAQGTLCSSESRKTEENRSDIYLTRTPGHWDSEEA
jgi:hypothetical protein